MSNFIGPALPPHLLNRLSPKEDSDDAENDKQIPKNSQEAFLVGPSYIAGSDCNRDSSQIRKKQYMKLKQSTDRTDVTGPQLPPHISDQTTAEQITEFGPSLSLREKTHRSDKEANVSTIGPSLPLKLRTKLSSKPKSSDTSDEEIDEIGPVLPPHLKSFDDEDHPQNSPINVSVIGPRLPPFLTSNRGRQSSPGGIEDKNDTSVIGPSLPPHLKSKFLDELPTVVEDENDSKPIIGPSLPAHLKLKEEVTQDETIDSEEMYGPALPPGFRPKTSLVEVKAKEAASESDEDLGPLPEEHISGSRIQQQLEVRAQKLRESMAEGECSASDTPVQRESWMVELPADRAPELGLRPRQFRMREGPEAGDRSVWTDTPADRERKNKAPKSRSPDRGTLEKLATQERDKAMQELAEQHSSKRGNRSLMDLHEEKLLAKRKKAERDGEVQERRPFSREVDLQVNRFDEAQKRSILKKAQHLNDRFSSGNSKFL